MLKRRIIPLLSLLDDRLVKTKHFKSPKDVGHPVKSASIYCDQDADELLLINIDRDNRQVHTILPMLKEISNTCFVPISVGGGISSFINAKQLFDAGADKIVINSALYSNYELLHEIVSVFGNQAVIVSVDVKRVADKFCLFSDCGRNRQTISLEDHIEKCMKFGFGELMVQNIDFDGQMKGMDCELYRYLLDFVEVPLIAASGAGNFSDLKEAFDVGTDAVVCGSLFNFGDNNPIRAKAFLRNHNIPLKKI